MEDYLHQLNAKQREAVEYLDSPQLVIAGAGSGKTRVLTYKIIHLLARGYTPGRILALTFTNKAANEMKSRITHLMGEGMTRRLWMGTFHSMFLRLLRIHYDKIGYRPGFTIYDASDSKNLIKSIIKDMGLDDKVYKPGVVQNAISMAKNALLSAAGYAANRELVEIDTKSKKPLIHAIYKAYEQRCRLANAMDFDDILFYTHRLLADNPDIANHYREFFQYVLVDEYQDTNYAQHVIVRQLTEGQDNLMVVGDDAQSIYSFRGAQIANILRLKEHYPSLRTFKLERNYRSTKNIIAAANSLIEKNRNQIFKNIFSENEKGAPVEIIKSFSDFEEGYLIAAKISSSKFLNHDSYADYAILYRTNAQSRILEESLRKRNIPYKIFGGLSFYQRKEVKDAIAYFRLSVNPHDDEALRRIINFPARGIGETTMGKIARTAMDNGKSIWETIQPDTIGVIPINSGTRKKIEGFREIIDDFIKRNAEGENAYELARHIIKRTELLSMLLTDHTPESISKQENLNELLNGVKNFVDARVEEDDENHTSMYDYLSDISLATDADGGESDSDDSVTMMTVHAAKGLEFRNVLIVGVEEDLFPSALSNTSAESIEEERRLLYVAITRAEKQCVISYAESRYRNGQTVACRPSRFIGDIDPSLLSFGNGARRPSSAPVVNPLERYREMKAFGMNGERGRRTAGAPWMKTVSRTGKRTDGVFATQPLADSGDDFRIHHIRELKTGNIIEHARFGKGEIIEKETVENNDRIVVNFFNEGTKTLLLKFARFRVVEN